MIDITSREERRNVHIVKVKGTINSGNTPELDEYLSKLVEEGVTKIVLNMEFVLGISSTGLRTILETLRKLKRVGGELVICNPSWQSMDNLDRAGFTGIIKIFDNEQDAHFTNSILNRWNQNYWGTSRILPKFIFGEIGIWPIWQNPSIRPCLIPQIDWRPAQEPHNIEV